MGTEKAMEKCDWFLSLECFVVCSGNVTYPLNLWLYVSMSSHYFLKKGSVTWTLKQEYILSGGYLRSYKDIYFSMLLDIF